LDAAAQENPQAVVLRARILLGCAQGQTSLEAVAPSHTMTQTVSKWRERFIERHLDDLLNIGRAQRVTQWLARWSI